METPLNVTQEHCPSFENEANSSASTMVKVMSQSLAVASVVEAKVEQSRRYPTRKRSSTTGDSPNYMGKEGIIANPKGEQSRRYPSRRAFSSYGDSRDLKGKDIKPLSKKTTLDIPLFSDKAKVTGSSKTKLIDLENANSQESQPTIMKNVMDESHTYVEGAECNSQDEQQNERATFCRAKVILQSYRTIYTRFLQEQHQVNSGKRGRLDLMALKHLKNMYTSISTAKKYLGSVPGIEVGDQFNFRAELHIVGLHRVIQAGIGCIKHGERTVAASIVSTGRCYGDIVDGSDVLVYSGSGGCGGDKSNKSLQPMDQKLEGGNLALKNSIDAQTPVRVIYGVMEDGHIDSPASKSKKVVKYIYDGLYLVEKYWSEKGSKGFSVFKFRLRRIPGQPHVNIKDYVVAQASKPQFLTKGDYVQKGLCVEDISEGKEKKPLGVVNTMDDDIPKPFTYITGMVYPSWYKLIPPEGCTCNDGCSDSVQCSCVVKNGGEVPFNSEGCITRARPVVYECGPRCGCPPSCHNRVSQHGIKYELEIFKTKSRGWGVRSLTHIPSGSFICEYTGEMLQEADANAREDDDYLFDIGKNYNDESLWEGLNNHNVHIKKATSKIMDEEEGFTVDAALYGNVGRFINHSCTPNLYAQNLLYDHDDVSMPHIMLFASESISPLEELTYHYNYAIGRVQNPDGTIKKKNCYCGSVECTGRLY